MPAAGLLTETDGTESCRQDPAQQHRPCAQG